MSIVDHSIQLLKPLHVMWFYLALQYSYTHHDDCQRFEDGRWII